MYLDTSKPLRHFTTLILFVVLSACGSSPKTSFYMLSAKSTSENNISVATKPVALGVWKVTLPDFLDRKELVMRNDQFEIKIADFSTWVGRLGNNMSQVIIDELSRKLRSNKIVMSPWRSYQKNDYQIKIDVDRFDGALGGEVVLKGVWSLLNSKGDKELMRRLFHYETTSIDKTHKEMVAALSRLTVQLAGQISEVVAQEHKR